MGYGEFDMKAMKPGGNWDLAKKFLACTAIICEEEMPYGSYFGDFSGDLIYGDLIHVVDFLYDDKQMYEMANILFPGTYLVKYNGSFTTVADWYEGTDELYDPEKNIHYIRRYDFCYGDGTIDGKHMIEYKDVQKQCDKLAKKYNCTLKYDEDHYIIEGLEEDSEKFEELEDKLRELISDCLYEKEKCHERNYKLNPIEKKLKNKAFRKKYINVLKELLEESNQNKFTDLSAFVLEKIEELKKIK